MEEEKKNRRDSRIGRMSGIKAFMDERKKA